MAAGLHLHRCSTYSLAYNYPGDTFSEFSTHKAYSATMRYGEAFFK